MKKTLELDEKTALKLHKTAAPEFKELLEQNFGKDFFNQKVSDKIKNYQDICDDLGVSSKDNDIKIEVEGFDDLDNKTLLNIVKAMRIAKVYNKGEEFKTIDQPRFYAWFKFSSGSGFVFDGTTYDYTFASASSAARFAFLRREDAEDAAKKFPDVYGNIIFPVR